MGAIDWTGISYPFRIENGGVAKSRSTIVSKDGSSPHLSESIVQICTTEVKERLVNKEIGLRIRKYQFATFSPDFDAYLEFEAKEAIEKFDPRVTVTKVNVIRDKKNGKIHLDITWELNNSVLGSKSQAGYRTLVPFYEGGVLNGA